MDWLGICFSVIITFAYFYDGVIAVLLIDGERQTEPLTNTRSLFAKYWNYRKTATNVAAWPPRTRSLLKKLYVKQREMAATRPGDESVEVLGTDDLTTNIAAFLHHRWSGAVALANFDGFGMKEAANRMVAKVRHLANHTQGSYELSLIGGLADDVTDKIFASIMRAFHELDVDIGLRFACVGEYNTRVQDGVNWPKVYGAGIYVEQGEIFVAQFSDKEKGPEEALRTARYLASEDVRVMDIYDSERGLLKIGPFDYRRLHNVDELLELSDSELLKRTSTVPDVEPVHVVHQTRAALQYLRDNPSAKAVFPKGRPHYYKRDKRGEQRTWRRVDGGIGRFWSTLYEALVKCY